MSEFRKSLISSVVGAVVGIIAISAVTCSLWFVFSRFDLGIFSGLIGIFIGVIAGAFIAMKVGDWVGRFLDHHT